MSLKDDIATLNAAGKSSQGTPPAVGGHKGSAIAPKAHAATPAGDSDTEMKREGDKASSAVDPTPATNTPAPKKPAPAAKKTNKVAGKANGKVVSKAEVSSEKFADALIRNEMNATAAYKELRPKVKDTTAAANGHRLLRKAETIEILTPMLERLFVRAGIETEYVFRRWLEIASGSAADYFKFESGEPVLDMSDMTPAERANLKSISVSHTQHGTNYKIEVYDAQKAVDTIGKHLGLLIERLGDEDVERIGDLIEQGVNRIRETRDLDGWKDVILGVEFTEVN